MRPLLYGIISLTTFNRAISALPSHHWPAPSLLTKRMASSAQYKTIAVSMISLSKMQPLSPSSQTSLTNYIMPATSPSSTFIGVTTTFVSIRAMSGRLLSRLPWVYLNHSS